MNSTQMYVSIPRKKHKQNSSPKITFKSTKKLSVELVPPGTFPGAENNYLIQYVSIYITEQNYKNCLYGGTLPPANIREIINRIDISGYRYGNFLSVINPYKKNKDSRNSPPKSN